MARPYEQRLKSISIADIVDYSEGEPLDGSSFLLGNYELVGHGRVTSPTCGMFSNLFLGCDCVEKHDRVTLDGVVHRGEVHIHKPVFLSCDKPSCPVCKDSWANREAMAIEHRLAEGSKHFGQVEHLMISVPYCDYGLDIDVLREKIIKLLKGRGIVGACLIPHGGRYANPVEARRKGVVAGWRLSVHFHVLGYILGAYSKCRHCERKWNCDPACDGVDSRLWKAFNEDGYYMKVFGKRKSVFKTARYLLGHSTMKRNSVRSHIVTWMGCVSYRKMKVTKDMRKALCPICHEPMVLLRYKGLNLDMWMLIYGGSCDVPLKEETDWSLEESESVWERYIPSVSYGYYSES